MEHLYIAGPYTKDDPVINTNAAIKVASIIFERHLYVPHLPHLTLFWHLVDPHPIGFWYALDQEYLRKCDAFVRLPGNSTGADQEQEVAEMLGLVIIPFMSLPPAAVRAWIDRDPSQPQSEPDYDHAHPAEH